MIPRLLAWLQAAAGRAAELLRALNSRMPPRLQAAAGRAAEMAREAARRMPGAFSRVSALMPARFRSAVGRAADMARAAARRMPNAFSRMSTRFQLVIGGAAALTLAATLVGWFFINRVSDVQDQVNEGSLPEITAAFLVTEYTGSLVAAAPRLTTAETQADLNQVSADIDRQYRAFEEQLAILEGGGAEGNAERVARIREHGDTLISSINGIALSMPETFDLAAREDTLRVDLTAAQDAVDVALFPSVDDQFFYLVTGYRELDEPHDARPDYFTTEQLNSYRHLADLHTDATSAAQVLASVFTVSDAAQVEPLRERFEAAAGRIQNTFAVYQDPAAQFRLAPIIDALIQLGSGEGSAFNLAERQLTLAASQREQLARNNDIALELTDEVEALVGAANARAAEATLASDQAALSGRTWLLVIGAFSVGSALMVDWLFVYRVLLSRLASLSDRMRRMAGGDLEQEVEVSGRDEIADMAAALEKFRQNALEVQRLNLVELMAQELEEKNATLDKQKDDLEEALAELSKAQDQIVMREKLAELGSLTAGVAHEIRNPLNFVKNFSESSAELLEELNEVLQESSEQLTEKQRKDIEDISQDLVSNLERIRSHGERANRIVQDMLMMGRGGGESRSIVINDLLHEHALLAYHSARALDPDFQLDMREELDENAGEIVVVPEDMGRVFLNMVSNACYATDQKRRGAAQGEPYMPTLTLGTQRGEDDVVIRIRDNGGGIPDEIREKIFNPFFTTKPTDQGTGLGLALSNDIVRKHGGEIAVESEPGEYTEMIVTLPFSPPERLGDEDAEEEERDGEAVAAESAATGERTQADGEDEG